MILSLALVAACESDSLKPKPIVNDPSLYWDLELSHHAVTLATTTFYDTLRVVATPRNYQGERLAGFPAATYVSRNLERVAVTSEGLLVAVNVTSPTQPVWVVASLTVGNLNHKDSVLVKVMNMDPLPVLDGFSVHPLPPDSAKLATTQYAFGGSTPFSSPVDSILVQATGADGMPIDFTTFGGGLPIYIRSSDPTLVTVGTLGTGGVYYARLAAIGGGQIRGLKPGALTLYASATVFGVTKADTLSYQIGLPIAATVVIQNLAIGTFKPGQLTGPDWHVATGADVVWAMNDGLNTFDVFSGYYALNPRSVVETDITFQDEDLSKIVSVGGYTPGRQQTEYCAGGAIGTTTSIYTDCSHSGNFILGGGSFTGTTAEPAMIAIRRFPVPGTYEFRSTIHGTSGRIVVSDDD